MVYFETSARSCWHLRFLANHAKLTSSRKVALPSIAPLFSVKNGCISNRMVNSFFPSSYTFQGVFPLNRGAMGEKLLRKKAPEIQFFWDTPDGTWKGAPFWKRRFLLESIIFYVQINFEGSTPNLIDQMLTLKGLFFRTRDFGHRFWWGNYLCNRCPLV